MSSDSQNTLWETVPRENAINIGGGGQQMSTARPYDLLSLHMSINLFAWSYINITLFKLPRFLTCLIAAHHIRSQESSQRDLGGNAGQDETIWASLIIFNR